MLLSTRSRHMLPATRRLLLPLGLLGLFVLAALSPLILAPPRRTAPAAGPASAAAPASAESSGAASETELLLAASKQAHTNCLIGALVDGGFGPARDPLFGVDDVLRALDTERVLARSYGELPSMRAELNWLGQLTPHTDLGKRSWEDVRFLLGCLHGYLDAALRADERVVARIHAQPAESYDGGSLQAFQGLEFGDLLGLWD
jgi:hypothetical protein